MDKCLMCKIGIHDWEVLERKDIPRLEEEVKAIIEKRYEHSILSWGYKNFVKKVCLKCCKVVDTITPFKKKVEENYYKKEERKKKAAVLIKKGIQDIKNSKVTKVKDLNKFLKGL